MDSGPRLVKPPVAYQMCGGISESTARRLIAAGEFPRPVVLASDSSGRPVRVAFVEDELFAWNAAKVRADRERRASSK